MQAHETMDRVDVAEAVVHHLKARKETRRLATRSVTRNATMPVPTVPTNPARSRHGQGGDLHPPVRAADPRRPLYRVLASQPCPRE